MDSLIKKIEAKEILDSRGNPTISVSVYANGEVGTFDVPSGASTGTHEALELRDGEERFGGLGVKKAITNAQMAAPILLDMDVADQRGIDERLLKLDGTPNKSKLGANAILGISVACAKVAAKIKGVETWEHLQSLNFIKPSRKSPLLYMNLINGGLHSSSRLAFQEYHLVPQVENPKESLEIGVAVMKELKKIIKSELNPAFANIGDEGGFAPDIEDVELPLALLKKASEQAKVFEKVKFALDVAASSFFENGKYKIAGKELSAEELSKIYEDISLKYPMLSIEDPFAEESFEDFTKINTGKFIVVGDDLTVTNPERLKQAIASKSISGIIIKLNQIGTLTETMDVMRIARENDIELIVSHRSGETNDDFIADLAYSAGAFGLKTGAPQRGERVAKYNRLVEIAKM